MSPDNLLRTSGFMKCAEWKYDWMKQEAFKFQRRKKSFFLSVRVKTPDLYKLNVPWKYNDYKA
jgi:hypothetical protein